MQVVMQKLAAGPAGIRQIGSIHDVPEDEAADLIADGAVAPHAGSRVNPAAIEAAEATRAENNEIVEGAKKVPKTPKPLK